MGAPPAQPLCWPQGLAGARVQQVLEDASPAHPDAALDRATSCFRPLVGAQSWGTRAEGRAPGQAQGCAP